MEVSEDDDEHDDIDDIDGEDSDSDEIRMVSLWLQDCNYDGLLEFGHFKKQLKMVLVSDNN